MSKKEITAEEFDKIVDAGEDVSEYLEANSATKNVQVTVPIWMIKELDQFANHLSIPRQALIKMWLNDRLKTEIASVRSRKSAKDRRAM